MKACEYCSKQLDDQETICLFCGYDQKTKTINNTFKEKMAQEKGTREKSKIKKEKLHRGIDPRIKKFASFGIILTLFSLFFKHNFRISGVVYELSQPFAKLKNLSFSGGKTQGSKNGNLSELHLADVKSFEGNKRPLIKKNLKVEGIFFDPQAKSFVAINGNILSEGETVDEVTVKKIGKDSVELIVGREREIIRINQ